MKPIATNNISFFAGVALLILFSLPIIGLPAILICAFLVKNESVRKFARTILIIEFICGFILGVIEGLMPEGGISFPSDDGVQVFNYIRGFIG